MAPARCAVLALVVSVATATRDGWMLRGPADTARAVKLHLLVRHEPAALAALRERLAAVSTPGSGLYGQYYSAEELTVAIAPPPARVAAVSAWCDSLCRGDAHENFTVTMNRYSDAFTLTLPASEVEPLFGCQMMEYESASAVVPHVRAIDRDECSVPPALAEHIEVSACGEEAG